MLNYEYFFSGKGVGGNLQKRLLKVLIWLPIQ